MQTRVGKGRDVRVRKLGGCGKRCGEGMRDADAGWEGKGCEMRVRREGGGKGCEMRLRDGKGCEKQMRVGAWEIESRVTVALKSSGK